MRSAGAIFLATAALVIILMAIVMLRLQQGPLALPFLNEQFENRLSAELDGRKVEVGSVVFALGERDTPSGLRVRDLVLRDEAGVAVFTAPEVGARFQIRDVLNGAFEPTDVFLTGAEGRLIRDEAGVFSLEFLPPASTLGGERREGVPDSFNALLKALEDNSLPLVKNLKQVRIQGVSMTYDDRLSGQSWKTDDAALTVTRWPGAIQARMSIEIGQTDGSEPASLTFVGKRVFGETELDVSAQFTGIRLSELAAQSPDLGFLNSFDIPGSGNFDVRVSETGRLEALDGAFHLGPGTIADGTPEGMIVKDGIIKMSFDAARDRMFIDELTLASNKLNFRGYGHIDLIRHADQRIKAVEPQIWMRDVRAEIADRFAAPLVFRQAQVAARVRLDPLRIDLGAVHLLGDDDRIMVSGSLDRPNDQWDVSLDARGRDINTRRLVELWPVAAAPGARTWVDKFMPEGHVTRVDAGLRFDGGTPRVALSFAFQDGLAYPLPQMPPIVGGSGFATIDQKKFTIALQQGKVQPKGQQPIDLSGSVFHIPDITIKPAQADVVLIGKGQIPAVMALLDYKPLEFLKRVRTSPALARGLADVEARLEFPILKRLKPAMVTATARARLRNVSVASPLDALPVRADRLTLEADNRTLTVRGNAQVGKTPMAIRWEETFVPQAGSPRSRISASFALSATLLEALRAKGVARMLKGTAPSSLEAKMFRNKPLEFSLKTNLTDAEVAFAPAGWRKTKGEPGELSLDGVLGDRVVLRNMRVTAGGLDLSGTVRVSKSGALESAQFDRFRLGDAIDSGLTITPNANGVAYRIDGGVLNLGEIGRVLKAFDPAAETPVSNAPPVDLTIAVDRLILTQRLQLRPATGRYVSNSPEGVFMDFTGQVNEGTEAQLQLRRGEGGLELRLTSNNAGDLLRDADYFKSAFGGDLLLVVQPEPGTSDMNGRLLIKRVKIKRAPVLSRMFSIASVTGILETLSTGGLTFDTVDVPFSLRDGTLFLGQSVATGASIGLSLKGAYNEQADELDLRGVFSPAFLLNGLLSEVPLLGNVLTDRSGEGVFGFSYQVKGSSKSPNVSVNPLSILTPGALRRVFNGTETAPATQQAKQEPVLEGEEPVAPVAIEPPIPRSTKPDEYDR